MNWPVVIGIALVYGVICYVLPFGIVVESAIGLALGLILGSYLS